MVMWIFRTGVMLVCFASVSAASAAVSGHEEYIAQYRATGEKPDERAKLVERFLAEAEAYIAAHPDGAQIAQAKLNKALAIGLYGQRRDAEADKLFEQIRADYPDSPLMPEVLYYHARLFLYAFDGERLDEARTIQLQLVERFPSAAKTPPALLGAAQNTWWHAKDPQAAAKLFERLLKDYTGSDAEVEARANLLSLTTEAGDKASACAQVDALLERFAKARELAPPQLWQWLLTGPVTDACEAIGEWERAERVLRIAIEVYPGGELEMRARAELIQISIWRGMEESALEQIDSFLERYTAAPEGTPADAWARVLTGRVADACVRIEAWDRLERCHKTVLEAFPAGDLAKEALFGLAWAYGAGFQGKRCNQRVATLLAIARQYPQAPDAARALIEAAECCEWRLSDKERARELYEQVIDAYPGTRCELDARVRLISMMLYAGHEDVAVGLMGDYDSLLATEPNEERVRAGKLILASACHSFYGNNPSQTQFWQRARTRYIEIAETYPGTEEAAESLLHIALHFANPKNGDIDTARGYALRLLQDDPTSNRDRYAQVVKEIMQDTPLMLAPLEAGLREEARDLLARYPHFSSHEAHLFFSRCSGLHNAESLEKQVQKIMAYSRGQHDDELAKDALLFLAESYLRQRQPDRALRRLAELTQGGTALSSEDWRRIREARAFCHVLEGKPATAIIDLDEITDSLPDPQAAEPDQPRTEACYEYWRAVTRFEQRRYADSASLFSELTQRHPDTEWAQRAARYLDFLSPLLESGESLSERQS